MLKMAALSHSSPPILSLYNKTRIKNSLLSLRSSPRKTNISTIGYSSSSFCFNPLRFLIEIRSSKIRFSVSDKQMVMEKKIKRGSGVVCYAGPLTVSNLQWISTVSSAILLLAKGTAIQKSFIVPLFALQAPASIISWMKGEYGIWTAFLALVIRLFFFIPGDLELPFVALLMVIVAPYQAMSLRGRPEGSIIALALAGGLAVQHFLRAGSLQNAFERGSIVATLSIICITVVAGLLLI